VQSHHRIVSFFSFSSEQYSFGWYFMATTIKKGSGNLKPKPPRRAVKTSPTKEAQTIAELRQELAEALQRESTTGRENERLSNALTEALEQANCYW
jgi:hypothetical protein